MVIRFVFKRLREIELDRIERGIPEDRNARRGPERQVVCNDEALRTQIDRPPARSIHKSQGNKIHEQGTSEAKRSKQWQRHVELDRADSEQIAPDRIAPFNDVAAGVVDQQLARTNACDIEAAERRTAF